MLFFNVYIVILLLRKTLVVIVNSHRKILLGIVLAYYVLIQKFVYFLWLGYISHRSGFLGGRFVLTVILIEHSAYSRYTFCAYIGVGLVDRRHQSLSHVGRTTTERAFSCVSAFAIYHRAVELMFSLDKNLVNHAVIFSFLSRHPIIAVGILLDFFKRHT